MPTVSELILREGDDQKLANLRPLVAKGEDEQEVIDRLVDAWCGPQAGDLVNELYRLSFEELPYHPAAITGVDLINSNTMEPIDLGHLLRAVINRLKSSPPLENQTNPFIILIGCRIHACNATGLNLPVSLIATGCLFNVDTTFNYASFSGEFTYFSETTFSGKTTEFYNATFSGENISFAGARFSGDYTYFRDATFSGVNTDFSEATFAGEWAEFNGSTFSGKFTIFSSANFSNHYTAFQGSTFSGKMTEFGATKFSGGTTDFSYATFQGENTSFIGAKFVAENTSFHRTTFAGQNTKFASVSFSGENTYFLHATFSGEVTSFYDATFAGHVLLAGTTVTSNADLRRTSLELATWSPARPRRWHTRLRRGLTQPFDWKLVQKLGSLTALTRASYLSLLVVPLLAGLWDPANALLMEWTGRDGRVLPEVMPISWTLAYVSAFLVALGHLLYQTRGPELIKTRTLDQMLERADETNVRDNGVRDERLRQAFDHLKNRARIMPHRANAWLIERQGKLVWLPHYVDLYTDATLSEAQMIEKLIPRVREELEQDQEDEPSEDELKQQAQQRLSEMDPMQKAELARAFQELSAVDRKEIAVDEGERALFECEAFQNRFSAWCSGGCYILGGYLLLVIVFRQGLAVAMESGVPVKGLFAWTNASGKVFFLAIGLIFVGLLALGYASLWVDQIQNTRPSERSSRVRLVVNLGRRFDRLLQWFEGLPKSGYLALKQKWSQRAKR